MLRLKDESARLFVWSNAFYIVCLILCFYCLFVFMNAFRRVLGGYFIYICNVFKCFSFVSIAYLYSKTLICMSKRLCAYLNKFSSVCILCFTCFVCMSCLFVCLNVQLSLECLLVPYSCVSTSPSCLCVLVVYSCVLTCLTSS